MSNQSAAPGRLPDIFPTSSAASDGLNMTIRLILNARTISNNYGEVKIDKDITTQRIDPVDAVIDAWKVAMCGEQAQTTEEIVAEWLKMYERHTKVETKK